MDAFERKLISVRPDARQLLWHSMEFYGFVHYGVNTYTDREWGDGSEAPEIFAPTALDPDQWAETAVSAGMRGLILTAKHHDGFCLWPSKYTEHSVRHSPGSPDVVGMTARACEKAGIKFGVYLSPWDRNSAYYGSEAYNDYYKKQLVELLTGYGELFCVWLDGACGEGPNGKRQEYDFPGIYELVRTYQPSAVINICGPDVRWCGNEAGIARDAEWSVVSRSVNAQSADIGSRAALEGKDDLCWYPAETDTSIRRGWFFHDSDTETARDAEALAELYERTVGANSALLLNIPPDRSGRFSPTDCRALAGMGSILRRRYATQLPAAVSAEGKDITGLVSRDGIEEYYQADVKTPVLTLRLPEKRYISRLVLRENIALSQRIEGVSISADGRPAGRACVVGAKRIIPLELEASEITVSIEGSRGLPTVSYAALY